MSTIYEIGPFRLDSAAGVLTRSGLPTTLGGRAVAVLTALVKQPNEFIRKEAILDAAWPGVVVEEANLAVQISSIRRVLAEAPGGEHWVETLARRGYRFVGPVTEIQGIVPQSDAGRRDRTNLPEPMTSFIGRERELVEIKRLLPGKRLVTIVGIGGIGKTRLALQAAAEVIDAYRDGVWFVDLAPLADPALVPSAVAQVLGVREAAGKPITAAVCTRIRERQLLLLLDNCEHVLGASASLVETLLGSVANVTIIATSREPLRIAGEQTYPLQTLSLPDPAADMDSVGRSEAVQLFVERARGQQPGFELTAARARAVAELCLHLDGIPLALELAAARVPSLSIEQINARLDDRFLLLTGGVRTAMPRQQTLRATLDWSHDLLTEHERVTLRRLAVFPGSFTLGAASAVASDTAVGESAVTDLLSQLVARSMILADTGDAETRYRLLETTRVYAMENLVKSGEVDAVRRRHAEYFRKWFEPAVGRAPPLTEEPWRATYLPELDNVRAALDWALGPRGDPALGVALSGTSLWLWTALSLIDEGRRRLGSAVAMIDDGMPLPDRARLWLALGILRNVGQPIEAAAAVEHAIEMYRQLDDPLGLGSALVELGRIRVFMGRFEPAAGLFAEALPLLERAGRPRPIAVYCESVGFLSMLTGDFAGARANFERALSVYREIGATSSALAVLLNLSDMTWARNDFDAALSGFREAATMMRQSRYIKKDMLGVCLTNLAGVHTERDELSEALAAAREGLPLRREFDALSTLDHLALRAALAGKFANAGRIAGYTDFGFAAKQSRRQPNEARSRARLDALMAEKLAPAEFERLRAEGATLSEDDAIRLALEE